MANNTGGTAAPSIRVPAAAQALGAPKISSIRPQAPSKGVTRAKMPMAPKAKTPVLPRAKAPTQDRTPARAPRAQAPKVEKGFLEMNPDQLHHFVEKQVQSNTKAELQPYKARGQEITGTEQTVAKRYGAYGEATQSLLGGIQSSQEAGAKTADNLAAQVAVKGQGEVNTAGQNATTLNGGQLEPSVKAGTEAGATNIAGLGAAAQANSVAQGQSEANYLANIRAAAAQRVTEGQKGIASTYGKQRAENQGHEGQLLAKQSGAIAKLTEADSQTQFADKATKAKLASENIKIGISKEDQAHKERETTLKAKGAEVGHSLTARGQEITAQRDRETARLDERGKNITEKHYQEADKAAREKAHSTAEKGGLTSDEQFQIAEGLGSAYETIRQLREQKLSPTQIRNVLSTGSLRANVGGKPTTLKYSAVKNTTLVQAAFELWDYHKVSPHTEATLKSMGITIPPQKVVGL
jgi:hypothetical protein